MSRTGHSTILLLLGGMLVLFLVVALSLVALPLQAATTSGTTITVTTFDDELNDDGDCSLREAVQAANTDSRVDACPAGDGADTIVLDSGTYALSLEGNLENANATGDLDVLDNLTIEGQGADQTTIDGKKLDRVFDIIPEVVADFQVSITGVTIQRGKILQDVYAPPLDNIEVVGGAIRTITTLHLSDCTIRNNRSDGGSIFNGGTLVIKRSTIQNNRGDYGGGILSFDGAMVRIEGSTISENTATSFGGGILAYGPLTISKSTITGNTAGFDGGGINSYGRLTMEETTVSDNTAQGMGGGLALWAESTINESTIIGNQALQKTFGAGGIANAGTLYLRESEVSNNVAGSRENDGTQADTSGGGLLNAKTALVRNTTFVGNTAWGGLGGAIFNTSYMEITGGKVSNNTAANAGGIVNFPDATMTISGTAIQENTAPYAGGGIGNHGIMTLIHSTVSHNAMTQSPETHVYGGGIFNTGILDIAEESVIESNTSASHGAGIYNALTGTLTLSTTQIHQNRAEFFGGGVYNDGVLSLSHSTVSMNDALIGGGVLNGRTDNPNSTAMIDHSEIRENTAIREATVDQDGQEIHIIGSAGGIYNLATMEITGSVVHQNTALATGGIGNDRVLTIDGSAISENNATLTLAGGIGNTGLLDMDTCIIADNQAKTSAGGIFNAQLLELGAVGQATIKNSTIRGNTAQTQSGGGIQNEASLLLTGSTLMENRAMIGGGLNNKGDATLTNSTISDNTSSVPTDLPDLLLSDGTDTPVGGGIAIDVSGVLTLTNVTVSHNTAEAPGIGGGLFNNGVALLRNTLIANNVAGSDCEGGAIDSQGSNLASDASCNLSKATDQNKTDPLLSAIQDNGGPTWTHALQDSSPAIDAGDNDGCPETDQRGEPRPTDGDGDGTPTCDIGAYEQPGRDGGEPTEPELTPTPEPEPEPTPIPAVYLPLVERGE